MKKKVSKLLIVLMILLSSFTIIDNVYAWSDTDQKKENLFTSRATTSRVILKKMEKSDTLPRVFLENAYFNLYQVEEGEESLLKENLKTNDQGEIILLGLSEGSYYLQETLPPDGYTYDLDHEGQKIDKYPFEITTSKKDVYIQAWNVRRKGNLSLSKNVIYPEDVVQDEDVSFSFEINITGENTLSYRLNGGEEKTIENGGTIELKDGDVAKIEDVEMGAFYHIKEQAHEDFYSTSINSVGHIQEATQVVFDNYYIQKEGIIEVTKFVRDETDRDRLFEFEIELDFEGDIFYQINDQEIQKLENTFFLKHDDTIQIFGVPEGTKYTLSEVIQDDFESSIQVIKGTMGKDRIHHYDVLNDLTDDYLDSQGELSIEKEILYREDADTFSFQIHFDTEEEILYSYDRLNWEVYDLESLSFQSDQKVYFKNIPHGTAYKVVEESKDGYLSQVSSFEGKVLGNHTLDLKFKNEKLKEETSILKITKKVEGKEENDSFNFTLTYEDEEKHFSLKDGESIEFELPFNAYYEVVEEDYRNDGYTSTIENGSGVCNVSLCEVLVTNHYQASDEKVVLEGEKLWHYHPNSQKMIPEEIFVYIYNDLDELVSVETVREDDEGRWLYSVTVPKYKENGEAYRYYVREGNMDHFAVEYDGYTIHNTYYTPVSMQAKVEKQITNDPQLQDDFRFVLRSIDDNPFHYKVLDIKGSGESSFSEIAFTKPGTYRYIIYEEKQNNTNYIYDLDPVYLEVKVSEKDYQLSIESITYTKNGEENVEKALFINQYQEDIIEEPEVPNDLEKPDDTPNISSDAKPQPPQEDGNGASPQTPSKPNLPTTGVSLSLHMKLGFSFIILGMLIVLKTKIDD